MRKVIISGASGFLGRNLLALFGEDDDVIALTSDVRKLEEISCAAPVRILSNTAFLESNLDLNGFTLLHLAYARSHEAEPITDSIQFSVRLLQAAQAMGVRRIIHISSQSLYDVHRAAPAKVSDLVWPTNLYDIGKYYLEHWISEFAVKNRWDFVHLRIASLVGNNFPQRITTRLVQNALTKGEISINLNGKLFSYTHVRDMAEAVLIATHMEDPAFWNRTYNVGSMESYPLTHVAQAIGEVCAEEGITVTIHEAPAPENGENSSLDSLDFMERTGWQAKFSLKDIIRDEVKFQLRQNNDSLSRTKGNGLNV